MEVNKKKSDKEKFGEWFFKRQSKEVKKLIDKIDLDIKDIKMENNNQEPTRECCGKCYGKHNPMTNCPCHSIKPPIEECMFGKKGCLKKDYHELCSSTTKCLENLSPELSWELEFDKLGIAVKYKQNNQEIVDFDYLKPQLEVIKSFIKSEKEKSYEEGGKDPQVNKVMFKDEGYWFENMTFKEWKEGITAEAFNSGRASIVEWCVKKIEEMKVEELNSHWLYLVKPEQAFIKALDDILQALKNKEQ